MICEGPGVVAEGIQGLLMSRGLLVADEPGVTNKPCVVACSRGARGWLMSRGLL